MLSNRDLLAKTLQAEAGNQGLGGMMAVGSVIMNRIGSGQSLRDVILAPGQFSAWNSVTGYAGGEQGQDMEAIQPSKDAYAAADAILSGNYADITGGATHYYNPDISQPKWGASAGGDWTKIGAHLFGKADAPKRGKPTMDGQRTMPMQAQQMQQTQRQPRGLMDFLRDPRTRQTLASLDRSGMFEGIAEQAGRDVEIQEQQQRQQQMQNRTAEYLRTQPGGEPFAKAIESGMDARTVYSQYMREQAASGKLPAGENVQSSRPLPDGSGQIITMRDGSIVVRLISGDTLSGPAATAYFNKSQERAYEIDRRSKAAQTIGSKVTEDLAASKNKIAQARSDTQLTFNIIDEIINAGGTLLGVTGKTYGALDPETTPKRAYLVFNQNEIDLINKIKKLKGDVGVQAYQSLRGAGAITKEELQTAIDGLTRLDRMQSATQLVTELNNLKTRLSERLSILESKAAEVDAIEQSAAQTQDFVEPLAAPQTPTAQQPTAPAQPTPTAPAEPSFTLQDMGGGVMKKVYK